MCARFFNSFTTFCTNCAQGYKASGTGCVYDCPGGTKINGSCIKPSSSCSGDWRAATESEICSFIASGSFPYTGAKASSGKIVTSCTNAGMSPISASKCREYHEKEKVCNYSDCYYCGEFYIEPYCTDGAPPCGPMATSDCYCPVAGYTTYSCVQSDNKYACCYTLPAYFSDNTSITYNCIALSSAPSGVSSSTLCIKKN